LNGVFKRNPIIFVDRFYITEKAGEILESMGNTISETEFIEKVTRAKLKVVTYEYQK